MKFTAIDLELDQPSNKIIQIGAVAFDTDNQKNPIMSSFSRYCDPGSPVNWTHLLSNGKTLEQYLDPDFRVLYELRKMPTTLALSEFWKWQKDINVGKKFVQWGTGDHRLILEESRTSQVNYPQRTRAFNLKDSYQLFWQTTKGSGLTETCQSLGVSPPNPAHDAFQDALATGCVALHMFRQVSQLNRLLKELRK